MKVYPNGYRFRNYDEYEHKLHQPYNYEKHGIIQHIISSKIANSENRILRTMLNFIDQSLISLSRYTDELKYFKNYLWKNR